MNSHAQASSGNSGGSKGLVTLVLEVLTAITPPMFLAFAIVFISPNEIVSGLLYYALWVLFILSLAGPLCLAEENMRIHKTKILLQQYQYKRSTSDKNKAGQEENIEELASPNTNEKETPPNHLKENKPAPNDTDEIIDLLVSLVGNHTLLASLLAFIILFMLKCTNGDWLVENLCGYDSIHLSMIITILFLSILSVMYIVCSIMKIKKVLEERGALTWIETVGYYFCYLSITISFWITSFFAIWVKDILNLTACS